MQTVSRLYSSFQPETYKLDLTLEREKRKFKGAVEITGTLLADQPEIRLHAKDLDINAATAGECLDDWDFDEAAGELVLKCNKGNFKAGEQSIHLNFEGDITDPMHGIYPCYFEHDGVKKELLATQLESHHARELFPCIDEPEAKATFDVTLRTEKNIHVLGNMPVSEQTEEGDFLVTAFETSPKMSTYLLAFVVGEMQSKEMKTKNGILVRTWATLAQPAESLDFALKHAADTIDFFDEYFGVPYPLPKSDNVALPDFSSGAMENWGLITYRETALLVDPKNTGISQKQHVASVITHELSHQWFGNLVTMKWWDDLWLNESFASLMEYVGVDGLYPDWDIWLDFGPNDRAPALHRDMLPGVQAVRTDVNHPDEISTLFDPAIVYAKGSTVLNMLRSYIGDKAFREGLREYFGKHKYANTTGHDLWEAFAKASGQDITNFMNAWLEKPGYPLVRIDQQGKEISLTQKRLLNNQEDNKSLWPIPLFAEPALDTELLETREQTITAPDDTFRLLNKGSGSVFVTNYLSGDHRAYLAKMLSDGTLEPADRLRLLHESLLLARNGEQSLVESLSLALKEENEDRDAVWDVISMIIGDTRRFIEHDRTLERALKQLVQKLVTPQLEILGFEPRTDDTEETKKLRATFYAFGVWAEQEAALKHALDKFDEFNKPEDLDADLRGIIYAAGARWKDEAAYEKLFALYLETSSAEERQNIAGSLAATRKPEIIQKLLSHIKDPEVVRPQDVVFWFVYLLRKREAKEAAWNWMVNEWDWIEKMFASDKSYDYFPRLSASALTGSDWLQKYREFFEPKRDQPALTRVIEIGIEEIVSRTAWFERDEPRLREFLQ